MYDYGWLYRMDLGCNYRYRVGDVAGLSDSAATALGSWSAGGNALATAGSTAVST